MTIVRHGQKPYRVAVIHGGPGAPGSGWHLAELIHDELKIGVLEPYQSADTIAGLIAELDAQLHETGTLPAVLVGHSWGAWLAPLYTARHPAAVRQLILVGAGPLLAEYVPELEKRREARFNAEERRRFHELLQQLEHAPEAAADRDALLAELGALCGKADFYAPLSLPASPHPVAADGTAYARLWPEIAKLREAGQLPEVFRNLPVAPVFIHGDSDPHPPEGIRSVLANAGIPFSFHLLDCCGHEPWAERYARDAFAQLLRTIILPAL